ncbi:MAG TPA: fibro-slime domain-containing protein [Fibrobacteria bacterium]|nr:fibro-slime domain-containing protein [Fibrobacteria bacterium]
MKKTTHVLKWLLCGSLAAGCGKLNPFDDETKEDSSVEVKAKVRDFREGNATSSEGTHPHFNQNRGSCDAKALGAHTVKPELATTEGDDKAFPGDTKSPQLADSLPRDIARCFDPPDRFSDWFVDRGDDVNRPFYVVLKFDQTASGIYEYKNDKFFPIDNGAEFSKVSAGGPDPFGNLQTGTKDDVDLSQHVYGFTLEFHTRFKYSQGKGQFIAFEGDDDLWAFINGTRAIDLGGIHVAEKDTVHLDNLGLADQSDCALDFYFAERAVASSKLSIATNVVFMRPEE